MKIHGVSAKLLMLLISLAVARVILVGAKVFSMPMNVNEKQDFCWKRKNVCSKSNS